ncbi:MAG: cation:proton antiporter [Devosia sp.]|uniref:monovalent cation/H(+) antiporter subunit G n=1 Tax=unclassified Devosia TaxID=196773 RepID=UPI0019EB0391|nr:MULTISPECIES: monovalent cation/H(+) antiporter subunit G [unclassified Devosia]MBF0680038.1 cation:proton antiporter [Devosia sp.]WEJ35304.1 monovalent cation/H(+) antiporter subunit G [Devosia sp. SD17-2]
MMDAAEIPVWVAIIVSAFSIIGALLTLLGCVGLARFQDFYARIHAPTLGTSFGTIFIVMASMLYFFVSGQRPAVHELLILAFVLVTTPVTLMLLARAALYRDRAEANGNVPDPVGQDIVVEPETTPAQPS